jgi:hypothetical protein
MAITEPKEDTRVTKESILQDVIDQINELEDRTKSAKSLVDLFILH